MTQRRDKRKWYLLGAIFVAVFLFTFLKQESDENRMQVEAASLKNFDPGYIISDYQMSNSQSMTENEIQSFLTSKNNCNNTDEALYNRLTAAHPSIKWHFKDGHFVCMSEELFGDGEVIGEGETAAHIIWQAAQDYKINPQALLVLLQKESSLVTDKIPNNSDYRKATGYGCPDNAPCSEKYYGFKNQVRKAAALFSEVLDGGWTNYPLGNNYIQYNPSPSCGGSVVNVKNLATSALYRYTPYQPNAAAIAAGYGTAECGAYGNRNFYLFFEDWFGEILKEAPVVEEKVEPKGETTDSPDEEAVQLKPKEKAKIAIDERAKTATVLGKAKKQEIKWLKGDGYYQEFEHGYIFWTERAGAWDLSGGILTAWKATGGINGEFGYPTSGEMKHKNGLVYQTFENGSIYWDIKTGAWPIRSFAEEKWLELGGVNSKLGKFLTYGNCGLVNNGCYQAFETGYVYWTKKTGAFDVSGGIFQAYFKTGSEWGEYGYPTSSEKKHKNGLVYQTFENGSIYWDIKTGAWPIRSFAEEKWLELGGVNSKLGRMITNGACGLAKDGCYQAFQTGNIYWTKKTGAFDVSGGIFQAYFKENSEWGTLGYPTSSELISKDNKVYQTFEGGTINWDAKTGASVKKK
ncbi:hypothetical protein IKX73_02880 [Candidatus Saccharibacteria bacterium]|nr:hypothetical protein [Candidatus Saccharibacteria bacterium]